MRFMQFTGRALARALFGAIGGLVAWVITEPFVTDPRSAAEFHRPMTEVIRAMAFFGLVVGAGIGSALTGLEELLWGSRQRAKQMTGKIALLGGLGGAFALVIGNFIYNLFPHEFGKMSGLDVLARSLGWAAVGALLGLALGAVRKSWQGALHSGLGGLLGGAIGGLLFDTAAPLLGMVLTMGLAEPGLGSRLIGLTLMGALIGLFSMLAEQLLAPAVLKVVSSGRMEGREFTIDKPLVTVGRDERCDVALYYDREVWMRHAVLRWEDGGYAIVPEGKAFVQVNNQPVRHRRLKDGDFITIGQTRLVFRSRKTAAVVPSLASTSEKVCPSCGTGNRLTARFCHHCGHALHTLS